MTLKKIFAPSLISAGLSIFSAGIGFGIPVYFELMPPASVFFTAFGCVMLAFAAIDIIGVLVRKS